MIHDLPFHKTHPSAAIPGHVWPAGAPSSPELLPVPVAGAQEVAKLAGIDVVMDLQQEELTELEGAGELLHQLPHTLHKLCEHRGHLLGVPIQVATPTEVQKAE